MATKCPKCQSDNPETAAFCADCGTRIRGHVPDSPESGTCPQNSEGTSVSVTKTLISPAAEGSLVAGRYTILGKLGEGGMGVVHKAEDTRLKRTVALKFLPPELTKETEAKERFMREAQAAAALSHPHICTIYEVDEVDGKSFISMEHVEGQSVRERIKKGPLDLAEALSIAMQAAQGLEEAHKKGIVHRDIKSANIMITGAGQAKVMDFGLAKVFGASLITKEAKTMGTVAYMSPEQAQGQSVDHRTDIWSLGVVLYEMLTGQLPFGGEREGTILYSIIHRPPEAMRKITPAVAPQLERVVEKALEKKPGDRYQTMGELLEDLKALAEGLKPLRAKTGILRGKIFGIRKTYAFAGLATLILFTALAIILLVPKGGRVYDSIAILPLINDSGDPNEDYFANSLTELLISELYKVADLRVVPPGAVRSYKNSDKPPAEIAKELNVKALVQASVLKSGDRVRLIATLSDPIKNKILWTDKLEREYSEILILQSELCQAIVRGISVAVTPAELSRLSEDRNVVRQAYDIYLQGLDWWSTSAGQADVSESERLRRSLEWFQKAIDIDPTLAEAHAWKAHVLVQLSFGGLGDQNQINTKAKEAAQEALKIDPDLPIAHRSLGIVKLTGDWDFLGAEHETKLANDIEPGNYLTKICYLQTLAFSGKADETVTLLYRWIDALKKNDSPRVHHSQNTMLLLFAGRFKEALEEQKIVIKSRTKPTWFDVSILAVAYAMNDLNAVALAEIEKVKDLPGPQEDIWFQSNYGWILGRNGRREDALDILKKITLLHAKSNADDSFSSACVYAGIGDNDKALEHLLNAYENHSAEITRLISYWPLRSLHGDPRFEELARKVGFPEVSSAISKRN